MLPAVKSLLPALLLLAGLSARAETNAAFRSGPGHVQLVELFTSEGCSSCPPADAWMSGLRRQEGLWNRFVPVAFHVDYWDHIGWKDPFSSHGFTERQSAYVRAWREYTLLTPSVVVDGRPWRGWRKGEVPAAGRVDHPGTLEVASRGSNWIVSLAPTGTGPWQFHAALLGCGIDVAVKAGENAGRTLRHDFTVLAYTNGALGASDPPSAEFTFATPRDLPEERAIAVWVTRRQSTLPLQAVGGMLK